MAANAMRLCNISNNSKRKIYTNFILFPITYVNFLRPLDNNSVSFGGISLWFHNALYRIDKRLDSDVPDYGALQRALFQLLHSCNAFL